MSWHECPQAEAVATPGEADPVELVILPHSRDLGGFEVRRALPSGRRRTVGPFIFFDQMGPSDFLPGAGIDVRPHPHIGLATLTYLFRGEILHRDSLGSVQPIRPGDVNWMTAGRGIVHSERTPLESRTGGASLFGIQAWVALPADAEECEPSLTHHAAASLPMIEDQGLRLRLIAGRLFDQHSPVATCSETLYADAQLNAGAVLPLDRGHEDRALYVVAGEVEIGGKKRAQGGLLVLKPGQASSVRAVKPARLLLLGGDSLDGPRHIWWNFVSSRKERIEQAKSDWREGRFEPVPDEREFIPLPAKA